MLSQQRWKPESPIYSSENGGLFDGHQIVLRLIIRFAGVSGEEKFYEDTNKYVEGLEVGSVIRDPFNQTFRRVR